MIVERLTLRVFAGLPNIRNPSHLAIKPFSHQLEGRSDLFGQPVFALPDARPNDSQWGGVKLPDC
jgi:hypothetical protein